MNEQNNWTMVSTVPSYQECRKNPSLALIDIEDLSDGGEPYASRMKAQLSIRKDGQYHRPIAFPPFSCFDLRVGLTPKDWKLLKRRSP